MAALEKARTRWRSTGERRHEAEPRKTVIESRMRAEEEQVQVGRRRIHTDERKRPG